MFGMLNDKVINAIYAAVTSVGNIMLLIQRIAWDASQGARNSLTCNHYLSNERHTRLIDRKTSVVSQFALKYLVLKSGSDAFDQLLIALRPFINPSMKGWLFEHWFFAELQRNDVNIGPTQSIWSKSVAQIVDPNSIPSLPNGFQGKAWFRPVLWNQGGYYGFYYDTEKEELVAGQSHDLKLSHFYNLATNVVKSLGEITNIRILFVVPNEVRREIGTIYFDTAMRYFGWEENNVANKIEFCIVPWKHI